MSRERPEYGDKITRPNGTFVCSVLDVGDERVVFAAVWQQPDGKFVDANYVSWPLSLWASRLADGWTFTPAHEPAGHPQSTDDDKGTT